jgi:hypothetical protein
MPETSEQMNQRNNAIDAALQGLGEGAAKTTTSSPRPGAPSTTPAVNQLPINEPERNAMADAVRKLTS